MDLNGVADELYALLPEQFTVARNGREKEARTLGDKELAAAIKRLRKPNQVAWLANQLARECQAELVPLLELGAGLREAAETLSGEQLRDFARQKRRLVSALVQQARRLATRYGRAVSADSVRGLEETLNAGLADPEAAALLVAGCLSEGLSHTGFGPGPAGSAQGGPGGPAPTANASRPSPLGATATGPRPDRAAERLARADAQVQEAQDLAREADEACRGARSELDRAETAVADIVDEVTRLTDELERAKSDQVRIEREQRQLHKAFERAERAAAAAKSNAQKVIDQRQRLLDPP